MNLYAFALLVMTLLAKTEHVKVTDDVVDLAHGIADAVTDDDQPAITDSKEGDVALEARFAWEESRFRRCEPGSKGPDCRCLSGDGGQSWGPLQLQPNGFTKSDACTMEAAPRIWLGMAHRSVQKCEKEFAKHWVHDDNGVLAELVSGTCWKGRALSRFRFRQAADIRAQAGAAQ